MKIMTSYEKHLIYPNDKKNGFWKTLLLLLVWFCCTNSIILIYEKTAKPFYFKYIPILKILVGFPHF